MSRSRALNRTNRLAAKKRRRALRAAVPELSPETPRITESHDHSEDLRQKALDQETLLELAEPSSS